MSEAVKIVLEERDGFGKAYCGRLRRAGYLPAVVYGPALDKTYSVKVETKAMLPYLMSMVIVSYLTFAFLSADTGYINKAILQPYFGKSVQFYMAKKYWPFILTFVNQWKSIGFSMVLYLSCLLTISPEYYEAAPQNNGHHDDNFEFGKDLFFRLWPLLSGSQEFRPLVCCNAND